jgi:hypothetical protein
MGLNFNRSAITGQIMSEAAPIPIFGTHNQTPPDGITMNVLQFLNELPFRPDVEIVIAGLPERVFLP